MENVFEVGTYNFYGEIRECITIRRKPSQIPYRIDLSLMKIGCMGHMNGPENYCSYVFFDGERAKKGIQFMLDCGWKQKE